MPTLTATVGGASSNAYALVTAGDTYFDERLQASNWTGESDADVKGRALVMATRRLDTFRWAGIKNATSQALEWPREGVFDKDGEEYATDSIPTFIQHAMFEIALDFLNQNASSEDPLSGDGLDRFDRAKIGPMEVEVNHARSSTDVPDHVRRLIAHALQSNGLMAELEKA